MTRFLIVAGEVSGEIYGARLMREIREILPGATFVGLGGDKMAREGLDLLYHCRDMAAIGVVEMLSKTRFFMGVIESVRRKIRAGEFDAVILIDYPGFNFRVARTAWERGLPVFYYVLPQIWAWRRYRMRAMKKWMDTVISVFPFEPKFYAEYGMTAHFVGHPMVDEIAPADVAARRVKNVTDDSHGVIAASDLLIAKSGTSVLEAALFGTPAVVVYRTSHVSYWLAKMLVKVKYSAIPNIIAGREIVREFHQSNFTPERVARHSLEMLGHPELMAEARREMESVREKLAGKGAAKRAAAVVVERLLKLKAKPGGPRG
ncbi:MAG: hypothetical protein HY098_03785 [Nitrospinae bacterium]|nr:hypothetical protein [Nitrospinota bacterium]